MAQYDYLIVGSGLYGAAFAQLMQEKGKRCLVLEKRAHIGGNVYTENIEGIEIHRYGAHIFHTNNEAVWRYASRFANFNNFVNSPIAFYKDEVYNLPFNMNTFSRIWGVATPAQAQAEIERQQHGCYVEKPANLEEQALNLVGKDIYEKLICGYTEKQWGRPCTELPPEIITRLPVRFTYDNNYFNARWQGIPEQGYTAWIAAMLENVEVRTGVDYLAKRDEWNKLAEKVVYTGAIDEFFNHSLGMLEYRTVRFETEVLDTPNYQGNAVVNYTHRDIPYTRIIEHKHFAPASAQPKTIISYEYSDEWHPGAEPYYPIGDTRNLALYAKYKAMTQNCKQIHFGGRLAEYKYYDMDRILELVLQRTTSCI